MNLMETVVANRLEDVGWEVLRGGWPDFLCIRKVGDQWFACCVEVKSGYDKLSTKQAQMHHALRLLGLRTLIVADPEVERLALLSNVSTRITKRMSREISKLAADEGKTKPHMTTLLLMEGLELRKQAAIDQPVED